MTLNFSLLLRKQPIGVTFYNLSRKKREVFTHPSRLFSTTQVRHQEMELPRVHKILKRLANPTLAAKWDNVGK